MGAAPNPGLVAGRTDDTETTGEGEVTPLPELYSGVW